MVAFCIARYVRTFTALAMISPRVISDTSDRINIASFAHGRAKSARCSGSDRKQDAYLGGARAGRRLGIFAAETVWRHLGDADEGEAERSDARRRGLASFCLARSADSSGSDRRRPARSSPHKYRPQHSPEFTR